MADYPLVEIIWEDAGLESTQMDIEQALQIKPMPRRNAGYCLYQGEDSVIICFGTIKDIEHNKKVHDQILVIPKGMVKGVKILGEINESILNKRD